MNKNWNTNPVNWPVISYSNIPKPRHFPSLQKMALSLSGFLQSLWFAQRAHAWGLCGTLVLPDKRRRLAGEPEVIQLGGYGNRDISSPLERAPRSATGAHTGAAAHTGSQSGGSPRIRFRSPPPSLRLGGERAVYRARPLQSCRKNNWDAIGDEPGESKPTGRDWRRMERETNCHRFHSHSLAIQKGLSLRGWFHRRSSHRENSEVEVTHQGIIFCSFLTN